MSLPAFFLPLIMKRPFVTIGSVDKSFHVHKHHTTLTPEGSALHSSRFTFCDRCVGDGWMDPMAKLAKKIPSLSISTSVLRKSGLDICSSQTAVVMPVNDRQ
jgi:hypothetical protein